VTLEAWIASRTPPVPTAFRPSVVPTSPRREVPTPEAAVEALVDEAHVALGRALAREPQDRDGAFDLLAADAFATWAAEAALDVDDPETALLDLARTLSAAPR
jgi:hypothetical protein